MQIFVKFLSGKTITLNVKETDTLLNIKEKIKDMEGFTIDKQKLVYAGKILEDDDKSLPHYKIQHNSMVHIVLTLSSGPCTFEVKFIGKTITLDYRSAYTILNIKEKIKDMEGIPID
jgi:ubiquitin C